jgi:hypothetical protein
MRDGTSAAAVVLPLGVAVELVATKWRDDQTIVSPTAADVEFVAYEGGHGWNGGLWGRLNKGVERLTEHAAK